ncbi:MAG: hypothetical protein IT437_05350 [Phycisphaerales bacterium]|nr:hypothetical protein [Phycisphaerales bacterium]
MLRTLPLLVAIAWITGCAATPLPTYEPMDAGRALDVIARRLDSVRTVSATAGVTLSDRTGSSVRLDGALAVEFPDRLRLRAWKLNTAVFDVTALADQVWMLTSDRMSAEQVGSIPARGILAARDLLGPAFFRSAREAPGTSVSTLVVEGVLPDGTSAVCEIDRATLTPRLYRAGDSTLTLDRYRVISGVPWAGLWRLDSTRGAVTVRFDRIELGAPLPPAAMTPPRRAVRVAP